MTECTEDHGKLRYERISDKYGSQLYKLTGSYASLLKPRPVEADDGDEACGRFRR